MKKIFAINGSASENSSNEKLLRNFSRFTKDVFEVTIFNNLKNLPHFDPELSIDHTPQAILDLQQNIENADGIVICTPEYVFSIPSGLKNAMEWCISTTVFSGKPTGLITASANGEKSHEQLQLIMKTAMAKFIPETTLLIQGIKGKVNLDGDIIDSRTKNDLETFIEAFNMLME